MSAPLTERTFHAHCFDLSNILHISQSGHKYSSFMVLAADIQGHRGGIICSSSITSLAAINLCKPRIYCTDVWMHLSEQYMSILYVNAFDSTAWLKAHTCEVETATVKVSGAAGLSSGAVSVASPGTGAGTESRLDPGLGAGRASTSEMESSVMGTNSEGVMAVVRSSDTIGDWRELSPGAPSSSPGHEPGVSPPVPGVSVVVLGGSRLTTGGLLWSEVREKRWWAEKDFGSSCFLWREERLLLRLPPL